MNKQCRARADETDTQNLNKRSYNNNTQNQSIHLRGLARPATPMHRLHIHYMQSRPLLNHFLYFHKDILPQYETRSQLLAEFKL